MLKSSFVGIFCFDWVRPCSRVTAIVWIWNFFPRFLVSYKWEPMGQLAKATNNQLLIESLGPWTAWHEDEYHSCLTEQSVHLLELLIHHEKLNAGQGPSKCKSINMFNNFYKNILENRIEILDNKKGYNDIPWAQSNPGWAKPFV